MAVAKAQSKKATPDFDAVFARLRSILTPHARRFAVKEDTPKCYYLETKKPIYHGKPACFGAVRMGKNYVSFHLIPVYGSPKMQADLSPALRKRMQGKACFNFKQIDEELFRELKQVTAAGVKGFEEFWTNFTPGAGCP